MQDDQIIKTESSRRSLHIVIGGLGLFLAVSGIAALMVACVFCPPVILPLLGIMKLGGAIMTTYGGLLLWGALSFRRHHSLKAQTRTSGNY
jgi:hypothetical protein